MLPVELLCGSLGSDILSFKPHRSPARFGRLFGGGRQLIDGLRFPIPTKN
jgi:hypothetical protein